MQSSNALNNLIHLAFIIALCILSYISIQHSQTFEMTFQEPLLLDQTNLPYYDTLNPFSDHKNNFDHGPGYHNLTKFFVPFVGEQFFQLRYLSIFFFIFSLLIFYVLFLKLSKPIIALTTCLLFAFHYQIFDLFTIVSPYATAMFALSLLYLIHFNFNKSLLHKFIHAIVCLMCVLIHFSTALPILISLYLLYKKNDLKIRRDYIYYSPLLLYLLLKTPMIIYFRLFYRKKSTRFYDEGVIFNIKKFLQHFDIYLPPGEIIFGSSEMSALYIIGSLIALFFLLYLVGKLALQKDDSELTKFLKIYLLLFVVIYFTLNLLSYREIVTRYFFGVLPLLYFYLSQNIFRIQSIKKVILSLSVLLSIAYTKQHNININLNQMLREPLISMHKALFNQLELKSEDRICFFPEGHFAEYILYLHTHKNFESRNDHLNKTNFICDSKKVFEKDFFYLLTLKYDFKMDNVCQKILDLKNCETNHSHELVYSKKRHLNNFSFDIYKISKTGAF